MALLTIPVWTTPPDWADPVTEGLEWKTNVFSSRTAAEQRQSVRISPRRYLEYTMRPVGEDRSYFDALVSSAFQTNFYMPVWFNPAYLRSAASVAATTIAVRDASAALKVAPIVILVGDRGYQYDISEVTSVATVGNVTTFTLTTPLTRAWPVGASVFEAVSVSLDAQPSFTRLSSNAIEATARFDFNGPNDWAGTVSLPTYRGLSVVALTTNEGDTQGGSYFRNSSMIDNQSGLIYRKDLSGSNFPIFQSSCTMIGTGDADDMRSLLYQLRGKAEAVWFVYPTDDFTLATRAASGATEIVVNRSGFTDLGGPVVGRQDIRILMGDGTSIYRRINSSSILVDGVREALELDSALPADLRPDSVAAISFMGVGRLDQDLIELVHLTDHEGVATVSFSTKLIPDTRDGTDWDALPFPLGEMGNCGPAVAGTFWARVNGGPWNGVPGLNVSIGEGGIDISAVAGPLWPLVGFNTGFDFSLPDQTANFGASAFTYPAPFRSSAWGAATTFDPDETASGIALSDDKLTAAAGLEQTGVFSRATVNSDTAIGFRYFEVTIERSAQNDYTGLCGPAFNPLSHTDHLGTIYITNDGQIWINGGSTGVTLGDVVPGILSILVYTGTGA